MRSRLFVTAALVLLIAAAWPVERVQGQAGAVTPQAGRGMIAGQVVDSVTGRPVPEAMVRIAGRPSGPPATGRGAPPPAPVIVDTQGRFFFSGLAVGLYTVEASRTGYLPPRAGLAIDLADAERMVDVRLPLARVASVSGSLNDENGDAVVGMDVVAFRRFTINGRSLLVPGARARSDDRGAYRIGSLAAGDYLVCACGRDPNPFDPVLLTTLASEPVNLMSVAMRALVVGSEVVSLDGTLRTYPLTLYPDSQTISRAQFVSLGPGDDKAAVDIRLSLVRATRVSGRIVGAPRALTADALRLVPAADAIVGVDLLQIPPMLLQTDGRFDFASVPPGQYRLIVMQRENAPAAAGPSGIAMGFVGARGASPPPTPTPGPARGPGAPSTEPPLWANELITVPEGGLSGLVVTLRPATPLNGRVQAAAGSSPGPPQAIANSFVSLQASTVGSIALASFTSARVAPDQTFSLPGVVPGRYWLTASAPGSLTLDTVTVGGVDTTDLPIDVEDQRPGEIVVSFTSVPLASLVVTTVGSGGSGFSRPPDGTSAVLFPADRKYWADPSAARRRIRAVQLTPKGSATMTDLPAGEYFVAIASAQEVQDWQEATRFDAFSRRAQHITLAGGARATVTVRR